jgi:hypothetical protein
LIFEIEDVFVDLDKENTYRIDEQKERNAKRKGRTGVEPVTSGRLLW